MRLFGVRRRFSAPVTALMGVALGFSLAGQAEDNGSYRIGPGDMLEIRVFGRPQLTTEIRVDGSGVIRMPLVKDPLPAICHTEAELSAEIATAYREYLKAPEVMVLLKEYSSQVVTLGGAVARPGTFQLKRRVRLNELVAVAGGLSSSAGDTIHVVHDAARYTCDAGPGPVVRPQDEATIVNTQELLRGEESANPYVLPGDFIHIAAARQAYVVGNVHNPTVVSLGEPVSLTRAIAIAGGRLPSSRNDVRVVRQRQMSPGQLQVLVFNIRDVERNRVEDVNLKPGDIVEVQTSITKSIAKTIIAAFASGAVYYPLLVLQ